ncbi:MAG: carbohydrate kinase family protein [Methylococcales bacterium]|jgi:adenosine kinase|nr:carbohydrate kinase family protein [Methylococcales bacterium]
MTALICGSYAFDTIMVFQDKFKNHILPDKVHILNVSFLVPELRREFGGCAGNIIYNLSLLGGKGLPMATVGQDFGPYAEWMDQCGISREHIKVIDDSYTGQAYITTDQDDNQITAFHPGAMSFSHQLTVPTDGSITLGIVSPDGRDGMISHAQAFKDAGIPFVFDPGQGMPMFNGEELLTFIDQATYITVNDYEAELMQEKTGLTIDELAANVDTLIVTLGGDGSKIYHAGEIIEVEAAPVSNLADPTGCGDAYRAGLLFGMMNKLDWLTTGRIAGLCGAIKIEQSGTQNHRFSKGEFEARFKASYGVDLTL